MSRARDRGLLRVHSGAGKAVYARDECTAHVVEINLTVACLEFAHDNMRMLDQLGERRATTLGTAQHDVDGKLRVAMHHHEKARPQYSIITKKTSRSVKCFTT